MAVSSPSSLSRRSDDPIDSYNSPSDIPDSGKLDPASLRLPFTTGSYWLPSTRARTGESLNLGGLSFPSIDNEDWSMDDLAPTANPNLWDMPWSPPIYGYAYNNSGIRAANVVSGDYGVGARENGLGWSC